MSAFLQAVRSLARRRSFAATAALTIALGIGANTAVYAVVHAVLLEPLPFREPQDLVQVWETHPELHNLQVSVPDYLDWKTSTKSLDLAAYTFQSLNRQTLLGQGLPTAVQGTDASAELFPMMGIQPLVGRLYTAQEEKTPVILISEELWRRKFSADRRVIGQSLRLGKTAFTIIGVLPQKSAFPVWADVWMPLSFMDSELYSTRKYHPLEVIGRVRTGITLHQAEMEMDKTARQLGAANPATNAKIGAFVVPLLDSVLGKVQAEVVIAWVAVGLVLLIACANLTHLMMGRALNGRYEIALRLALGASGFSVLWTFFLETLALAMGGGLLGIFSAQLAFPLIKHLAHGQVPRLEGVRLNVPVFLFGLLASFLVAIVFAAPSYLQVFRSDLTDHISSGSARGSRARQSWLSTLLMSSEVALSFAVLVAAVMLARSFSLTLKTEPGFQPAGVLAVHSPLVEGDSQKSFDLFRNRVAPELSAIPGVREVAAVNSVPFSLGTTERSRYATRFGIAGIAFPPGQFPTAQIRWCTPNYFNFIGMPLLYGRMLTSTDRTQPRYLINAAFAQRFFPHSNPVGQKLVLGVVSPHPESAEIVGVVGDVREFGLTSAPEPTMYSVDVSSEMDVVLKTTATDAALENRVSATMRRINPEEAIGLIRTLDSHIVASLARQRFILALITTFAGLAIVLCVIGIHGVFSYSVSRRLREFGIRSAIGARRRDLLSQVIRECLVAVLPGLLAGIAISGAAAKFFRTLLYRVSPTDPFSSGLAILCVLTLCVGSVALPAVRAAKVNPAGILREQ